MASVWEFLSQNNQGIMKLFGEPVAALNKWAKVVEESKIQADGSTRPSQVASGPKGLAFVALRAGLRKLDEKAGGGQCDRDGR